MKDGQYRTRPSILAAIAPHAFKAISVANKTVLGDERAKYVLAGIEKGMQNENDE